MYGENVKIKNREVLGLQRRVSAFKTAESWDDVPHAGFTIDFDITDMKIKLKEFNNSSKFDGVKISINTLMLKIIAEGLKESPEMNAFVKYHNKKNYGDITRLDDINIAMPLVLPDGTNITPVIRQVGKKNLKELGESVLELQHKLKKTNSQILLFDVAMRESLEKVKKGHIIHILNRLRKNLMGKYKIKRPSKAEKEEYYKIPETDRLVVDDLLSATFLVSNLGSVYRRLPINFNFLIIIPPQTSVVGLGSIVKKPVVRDGKVEIRDIIPVTVLFDHRAIDFQHCLGFLNKLADIEADPSIILPDIAFAAAKNN